MHGGVTSRRVPEALQLALADPPYATKTEAVKVRWAVSLAFTWRRAGLATCTCLAHEHMHTR